MDRRGGGGGRRRGVPLRGRLPGPALRTTEIEERFRRQCAADYEELSAQARELLRQVAPRRRPRSPPRADLASRSSRLKKRLGEVIALDFFAAPERAAAEALLRRLETRLQAGSRPAPATPAAAEPPAPGGARGPDLGDPQGSPRRPHRLGLADPPLHRLRGALPLRRFAEPRGGAGRGAVRHRGRRVHPRRGPLHASRRWSARLGLADPALAQIAEIVHDIDLKDAKFGRADAPGILQLVDRSRARPSRGPRPPRPRLRPLRRPLRIVPPAPAGRRSAGARAASQGDTEWPRRWKRLAALALAWPALAVGRRARSAPPKRRTLPWTKVDAVFGAAGKDLPGGVHRFGWPRRDLHVRDRRGARASRPWRSARGAPSSRPGEDDQAMAMGDLVLLESELTPVVSALAGRRHRHHGHPQPPRRRVAARRLPALLRPRRRRGPRRQP